MKVCAVLLSVLVAVSGRSQPSDRTARSPGSAYYDRRMEELLHHKLEKFRSVMSSGYPSLSIPVTDPLNIPPVDMSSIFGGDVFRFQLLHVQIRNLSTFEITELRADTKRLKVRLTFQAPQISGRMQYTVAGSLYEVFPLQGSGRCDVVYHDVTVSTVARLKETNGRFQFAGFEDSSVDFASDEVSDRQHGAVHGSVSSILKLPSVCYSAQGKWLV
ncbi:hypothetical protein V5799_010259 [Amblyomma americanum]|uniref:Secreted protein n=1 Tax=Amblyomma americanum TaxID=6943 RepID=A0AAQ4F8J9_AMBAM